MKKIFYFIFSFFAILILISCKNKSDNDNNKFKPSLDKNTNCDIKIVGDYSNFEALENETKTFNDYYPNVRINYEKIDDYDNNIGTVLNSNSKPNIFFSYSKYEDSSDIMSHMEDLSAEDLKINIDCIKNSLIKKDKDNKVLMLPIFSRTYGMLVNEDLFKKENINVPKTWTKLLSSCQSFIDKGYLSPMMGYTKDSKYGNCMLNTIAYPLFVENLFDDPSALALANNLDSRAGEYTRDALNVVKELVNNGFINIDECNKIKDNYEAVIMRFFEGDVPMMLCAADTVSGTKKRESRSEAYKNSPFSYTYLPLPTDEDGGYFIDSPSVEFSVNKDCDNLDMTNEFMRFLICDKELNNMASVKGLISPVKNPSNSIYDNFLKMPASKTISPEVIGIKDQLTKQIRTAAHKVGQGELTVEEAVSMYGQF